MSNIIYIVTASSGSYEDYRRWNVKAFYTEEKANEFKEVYNRALRDNKYKEKMKANSGEDFDYYLLYETYECEIEEIEIE